MFYVPLLFFLSLFYSPLSLTAMSSSLGDGVALLSFKSLITHDPYEALSSWDWGGGNRSLQFCQWRGVTCSIKQRGQLRVTALDLEALDLAGPISPSLSNLTFLQRLHLPENQLSGPIPKELGLLSNLRHLNLSINMLHGEIPHSISQCFLLQNISMFLNSLSGSIPPSLGNISTLRIVSLSRNELEGSIPASLGNLSSLHALSLSTNNLVGNIPPSLGNLHLTELRILDLSSNNLEGSIPASLGNLSSLNGLSLSTNNLVGDIPPSLGNLHLLAELYLHNNNLSGSIPESLGNLCSIIVLALMSNKLTGRIPQSLWNLSSLTQLYLSLNMLVGELPQHDIGHNMPRLQILALAANNLYGPISSSFQNSSALEFIELEANRFSGKIPKEIGNVNSLTHLLLSDNNLEARSSSDWDFLRALTNCTSLELLEIGENERLIGKLPDSVGNLSRRMVRLNMKRCQIYGNMNAGIGNLINLKFLSIASNHFTGAIPESIGNLQMLSRLDFSSNELSGQIPITLGNLTQLNELYLYDNNLQGHIPSSLARCKHLEKLSLSKNGLTGSFPREILAISTIHALDISKNALEGSLPQEVGNLINLVILIASNNNFFGKIPSSLGKCVELQYIYLESNLFQGVIPSSFDALKGLQKLNLSNNRLSGQIPRYLQNFSTIEYLDVSNNLLEGEVPEDGIFLNISKVLVFGNDKLCGGIAEFRLPLCGDKGSKRRTGTLALTTITSIVGFFLLIIIMFFGFTKWRRKLIGPPSIRVKEVDQHMRVSYADLLKATDLFSADNLIGKGSHGSVYRGNIMDHDKPKVIAVKVLNLYQHGASRSFDAECKVLRNIRHRNLVNVLTSCSSTNYKGDDFKALVYEFMPNGSLENWLHPQINDQSSIKTLALLQRMNIAIDVASSLDYLHHRGLVPVVHCDLKPSNVLLDVDMAAHVGDFGLARLLAKPMSEFVQTSASSTALKGTIGYVAPEYGVASKVSTEGDVYSYGIMLLEMFTGKRPTEEIFKEGLNLHRFVEMALPNMVANVLDPLLYSMEEGVEAATYIVVQKRNLSIHEMECVASIFNIGLSCSMDSPIERMQMSHALNDLLSIRNDFLKATNA